MKTKFFMQNKPSTVNLDATGLSIGRLATSVAYYLMGKDKITFSKNSDPNVTVIVKSISNINITKKKMDYIKRYHHTGYFGNLKMRDGNYFVKNNKLDELLQLIVRGMMPKTTNFKQIVKRRLKFQ